MHLKGYIVQVSIGARLCVICPEIQMERQTTDVIFILSPHADGYIWSTKTVLPNLHQNLCPFYLPLALHHENEEGPLEFSVTLADPCLCHITWKWRHNVKKDSIYKEINSSKCSDLFMKKIFLILSTFSFCWDYFTHHINAKPLYHAW